MSTHTRTCGNVDVYPCDAPSGTILRDTIYCINLSQADTQFRLFTVPCKILLGPTLSGYAHGSRKGFPFHYPFLLTFRFEEGLWISRFPRKRCPHMPGSETPPGCSPTCITLKLMLPSLPDHEVGTREMVISELNSPPVLPPVNASANVLLQSPHDSRLVWCAKPSP